MNIKDFIEKAKQLKTEILYKHLKIDQARDYLMRLSDRERQIVSIAAAVVGILLLLGIHSIIAASLDSKEKGINRDIRDFEKILNLRNEYLSYFAIIRKIENTIKRTPPNFSLATHLENLAGEHGIKIESMKPKPATPNDFYKETQVEAKVKGVLLKTLVNFMYEIENSKEFLKITSVQIRPSYSKQMYLDVTFTVSTFSPV